MLKKILPLIIILAVLVLGYLFVSPLKNETSPETAIRVRVGEFSQSMKNVSLMLPDDQLFQAIETHYGPFISEGLLTGWKMNPKSAPGKTDETSSPSHIEILAIEPTDDGAYEVQGKLIETYNPPRNGQQTSFYQVAMKFRMQDGTFVITGFTKQLPLQ
jgi:hypothetical protein